MNKARFYLLLLAMAALGLALSSVEMPGMPKREKLFHVAADALLIASFLAGTVDVYLKQRLLKEAAFDIFQYMIGYQLPVGVSERIKQLVRETSLLRRDCILRWTLDWVDTTKKDEVWSRLEATFNVENLTSKDDLYFHRTSATDPSDQTTKVEAMWCHCWQETSDYHHAGEHLKAEPEDETGDEWIKGPPITIPARNRERELKCSFGARYISKHKAAKGDDSYTFSFPTLSVTVVVNAPPELEIKVDPKADRNHLGNNYEYPRLFVGNESVTIRWNRKQPPKG